jgi:hypothetical protein
MNICRSCNDDIEDWCHKDFCLCKCHYPLVYHHNVLLNMDKK